jgi:predicted DCC family thiol-disulfide oxidoreductase YuxK
MMFDHLILFDSECPLCHHSVEHIIEIDIHKRFIFAPLNGETAAELLEGPQRNLRKLDTLILVENYQSTERKFHIQSKAVLRTYWLIGNGWGLIGIFSFLPSCISDIFYRCIATHRHRFKLKMPKEPGPAERFLP